MGNHCIQSGRRGEEVDARGIRASLHVEIFFSSRYVASGDQTPILRTGYWASYNIPFYEYVYDVSGYPELVKKFGPDFSYQLCPRAKIFRRDEPSV